MEAKSAAPKPEFETAVTLLLPADGSSVIGDLAFNSPQISLRRKATFDDLYRMVCDIKSQLESIRTVNHHLTEMKKVMMAAKEAQTKASLRPN